jgi:hypothetical protein
MKEAGVTNLNVNIAGDPLEIVPKLKEWAA